METNFSGYLEQLLSRMFHLRSSGFLCDTVIVTADRELHAHSIILAAASPVFKAAFLTCSTVSCTDYRLLLDGLDGDLMELILKCIYCGFSALKLVNVIADRESLAEVCDQLGVSWISSSVNCLNEMANGANDAVDCIEFDDQQLCEASSGKHFSLSKHTVGNSCIGLDMQSDRGCVMSTAVDESHCNELHTRCDSAASDVQAVVPVYVCDICQKSCADAKVLRDHRQFHKGCAACANCGLMFISKAILRRHLLNKCCKQSIQCYLCSRVYAGSKSFAEHAATYSEAMLCSICCQPFQTVEELRAHEEKHLLKVYCCSVCGCNFRTQSHLRQHARNHETARSSVAAVSLQNPSSAEAASIVTPTITDSIGDDSRVLYSCRSKPASCSGSMKISPLQQIGSKTPQCLTLQDEQKCKRNHLVCAICARTFQRLTDLYLHLQRHTGEMGYRCSVCGRAFRKSGTLSRHMKVHTGERAYVCETCGKSFKLLFHLRLHASIHSADRPFACDSCGKTFQCAARLKTHSLVHTGVKPFSCPVCARSFNRCSNMRAHMRVHDGRRGVVFGFDSGDDLASLLRQKSFSQAVSLQAHVQTHSQSVELESANLAAEMSLSSSVELARAQTTKQNDIYYDALPLVHLDSVDEVVC